MDLRLYPDNANKKDLIAFINSFGDIQSTAHLWDWPKGSVHYIWFDDEDYKSSTGVEITVFSRDDKNPSSRGYEWAIHVRNTCSATWYDVNMLNTILRQGRKKFGGYIIGDYGRNRYAPLWEDKSTPISRGLERIRQISSNNLSAIAHALPSEMKTPDNDDTDFTEFIRQLDPVRTLYNGLIPFLVSVFEFYCKEAFIIGLKCDANAQMKIINLGASPEQVADKISFQDLRNINKAYRTWLDINIKVILSQKIIIGKSLWILLDDLIKYRQNIIHRLGVDGTTSHTDFNKNIKVI